MPDPTPVDPSKPAAGGWTPSPMQLAIGTGLCASLGAFALSAPAIIPGVPGLVTAAICGALALGISTILGMKSAGPRVGV